MLSWMCSMPRRRGGEDMISRHEKEIKWGGERGGLFIFDI